MKLIKFLLLISLLIGCRQAAAVTGEWTAEAKVLKILEQRQVESNGKNIWQQNLELRVLNGESSGRTVISQGISDLVVNNAGVYQIGDRVVITASKNSDGSDNYQITDYVRSTALWWLLLLFIGLSLMVAGWRGLKSLGALLLSFFVIMKVLVPAVLAGWNPLLWGVLSALLILGLIIYLTEGWSRRAHIAVASISLSLLVTALLSWIFTLAARLSGLAAEETVFVAEAIGRSIDFRHLLLASFVIGTLGVLDDVVIGQIETVRQLKIANNRLSHFKLFTMSMAVGRSHFGAIINTLFLAYAGASFPLLLLFGLKNPPFATFGQIVNHEEVATEIVRTLVGVIGLALALPIATWLAVWLLPQEKET